MMKLKLLAILVLSFTLTVSAVNADPNKHGGGHGPDAVEVPQMGPPEIDVQGMQNQNQIKNHGLENAIQVHEQLIENGVDVQHSLEQLQENAGIDPAAEEPDPNNPVSEEPDPNNPVSEEPDPNSPVSEEPDPNSPVSEEPAVEEPAVEEPVTEQPDETAASSGIEGYASYQEFIDQNRDLFPGMADEDIMNYLEDTYGPEEQ